jgi:hypothetical protein
VQRQVRHSRLSIAFLTLCAALALSGCGDKGAGGVDPNLPPETTLAFAPDEGDTVVYRVRLNWFGWDPDGEVTHYLARWDSLDWFSTVSTDSVFVVETEPDRPDSSHSYRPHTFEVKAVDNDGAEDPTPASVTFTAMNAHPDTEILSGPSGAVGAFAEFEWAGSDPDGQVAGYGYRLSIRDGYDWIVVASADSLGADENVELFGPLDYGRHRFEVWAIDDRGAADPSPAADEFTVASEWPALRIRTNHLGTFTYTGPSWESGPFDHQPVEVLAGEQLVFDWYALPDIVGYRHAYDDTTVWPEWSIDDTHLEVLADPGLHTLYVCAEDLLGRVVRGWIRLDVHEASLDDYILVVDDYDLREEHPEWGTDADRSAFYDLLVASFGNRVEWEPSQHTDSGGPLPPDVATLSGASTVVWYADGQETTFRRLFGDIFHSPPTYNPLAGYMRIGGNLVLCGFETLQEILGSAYPIETSPGDTSLPHTFVRDVLGVGRAESSGQAANKDIPWRYGYCFHGAVPTDHGLFEPMYIDSLGKWSPIYEMDHPNYRRGGLPMVEKLEAYQSAALPIFEIDSYLNMEFDGEVCGLLALSGSDRGNVCYLGFPLYYLKTDDVQAFFDVLLPLFGEERR